MQSSEKKERGGVIVFVMLISLTLIFMISLCIDAYRGLIEQSQIKHVADQTALAALEAYVNLDSDIHADKLDEGLDRAAEIAGKNVSLMRQVKFVNNVAELKAKTSGSVTSGRWWSYKPATCMVGTCPCGSGAAAPPCFQACPDTGGCPQVTGRDSIFATAMQVKLNTTSANPLVGIFSGLMGQNEIEISNNSGATSQGSIAAVAPRTQILLIDLSQRALLDTDPPYYPSPPNIVPPLYGNPVGSTDCSSTPTPPTGFSCVYSTGMTYPVWVDTSRDPEPFSIELEAAHGALKNFLLNALPGDRIGIIGFSRDVASHTERIFPPVAASDPALQTMLQLTLTKDDAVYGTVAAARALRYARNFFPYSGQAADISGALNDTKNYLQTIAPTPSVEKVITLITQGVPDCNRTGLCGAPTDTTCYGIISPTSVTPGVDYARQQRQFRELLRGCVTDLFRNFNTRIDVALVGSGAMPHTLMLRSAGRGGAANKCMQDLEMRQRNYMNVKPFPAATEEANWINLGARAPKQFLPFTNPVSVAPFLQPSLYLYSAARLTRGFWTPIRPPCPNPLTATVTSLDQACRMVPQPPATPATPELAYTQVVINSALVTDGIEDLEGRIVCDDKFRTAEQQMSDAMDADFTRRSFVLTN